MLQTVNPVYRSLNRHLLVLGVERRLFFFLLLTCLTLFITFSSLLAPAVLFLVLWTGARLATQSDPKFLHIVLNSRRFALRYDPAKFSQKAAENE